MERFRKKLTAFVIVLAASMTLMSLPVMAKTNSKPATITKPTFVFVSENGTTTQQVKGNKLTLVKGTDQEKVTVQAVATLKNALSSDQLVVTPGASSEVEITTSGNNIFTIKGVSATKKTVVKFTYSVSNDVVKKGKQKNAPDIGEAKTKTVSLTIKVVDDAATVALEGNKMDISSNKVVAKPIEYVGKDDYIVGTAPRRIDVYKIDATDAKKDGKDAYTIPVTIPVALSGNSSGTKFAFTTTNKNAAAFSGKFKNGVLTGTIKVNRAAFTKEDGLASAVIGVGVKSTKVPFGSTAYYGKSDYIKLVIKPDALGKKIKLSDVSPVVNGKKGKKASLVIPAGSPDVEATVGAVYSSNGGKVSVEWEEVQDESRGYTIKNNGDNTAKLKVLKPFKTKKEINLKGTVKSLDASGKTVKVKNLSLKVTATKKVDKVAENIRSKGEGKKAIGEADGSTYYGTNMRTMWINGREERVRTFYYLAPKKNFSESFSVAALPNDDYQNGVAKGEISNVKLVAIKDVSDSEEHNKSKITLKKNKDKKTFTATLNLKKPSAKNPLTDEELVIYQIAAADSKNATTGQYGVGRYVAISVNPKEADKDVEIKINGSTSGKTMFKKGESETITVSANKDVPYTIESRNEDVVVVQVDKNVYKIYGNNTGDTYVDAKIAGVKEPKASLHVYVVGFDDMADVTMYPGETDRTLGTVAVNMEGATAEVSVSAKNNNDNITISGNATLKNGEQTAIKVLSANKIGDKGNSVKVTVEATAVFTVSGMNPITVTKSSTVTVDPYTVIVNNGMPVVIDTADQAIIPDVAIKKGETEANGKYSLSINASADDDGFAKVISDISISGNKAGTGTLTAIYTDVNGGEYKGTTQLTVTDKGGTKTYNNQTVISFNAINMAQAEIENVEITTEGGIDTIKKAYHRFLDNLRNVPKEEEVRFTVTLSGNSTVSSQNAGAAGSVGAEEPSGAVEPEVIEEEKTEEPAEASEPEVIEEEKTEEPAVKETAEETTEETAEITAEAAETVSGDNSVETEESAEAVPADDSKSGEVETPAEEEKEVIEDAEAEEAVKAEEPAAEAAEESEEAAAEESEEAAAGTISQNFVIVVTNGEPVVTPSESDVDQFIDKNFDDVSTLTMKITVDAVDKTIPNLLGIADQALSEKSQNYNKKVSIRFADVTIELENVHFNNGFYCIGETEKFAIKGTGDKTVVVFEGELHDGDGTQVGKLVKKSLKVKDLIAGIDYYDGTGNKDPDYDFLIDRRT